MYCTPFPSINPSSATYLFIVFFSVTTQSSWKQVIQLPICDLTLSQNVYFGTRVLSLQNDKGVQTGPEKLQGSVHLRTCHSLLDKTDTATPSFQNWLLSLLFFFFFKQDFSSKTCRCFGRGKVGQLCVSKVKKKEKKRATLLFILSWIQGRDEYEVKFSCQACFGLISTFL